MYKLSFTLHTTPKYLRVSLPGSSTEHIAPGKRTNGIKKSTSSSDASLRMNITKISWRKSQNSTIKKWRLQITWTKPDKQRQPTGSVKLECSPPERKVVSSSHSRVIPKTWKMAIDILSWAPSLRAISINQRGGCLVGRCCVNDSCVQMGN